MDNTKTIDNWEIFAAGEWSGSGGKSKWSEKDLDDMVVAFGETAKEMKPYLKLGHSGEQKLLQEDGYPSAGWITALKRVGNKLVAKVEGIPEKIFNLIQSRAYGRVSSEIYKNAELNGKKFPRLLKAVALLGADTPAVGTLQDFIDLYTSGAESVEQFGENCEVEILFNQEIPTMETVEITQAKLEEFTVKAAKFDSIEAELAEFKAENDTLRAEVKNLETIKGELAEFKRQSEEDKKAAFEKEVDFCIDGLVKDEKITPAEADFYKTMAKKDPEDFEMYKNFLESKTAGYSGENSEHTEIPEEMTEDDKIHEFANKIIAEGAKNGTVIDYGSACIQAEREIKGGE